MLCRNFKLLADSLEMVVLEGGKVKLVFLGVFLAGIEKRGNFVNRRSLFSISYYAIY